MSIAFVDANVVVYALGREHPAKRPCLEILRLIADRFATATASTEVLQELLHVYLRRGDASAARRNVALFDTVLGGVMESVTRTDILWAAEADLPPNLQARDRIHLAVMARLGITSIISTDRAFDGLPGITRLDPLALDSWRHTVFAQTS